MHLNAKLTLMRQGSVVGAQIVTNGDDNEVYSMATKK